MTRPRSRRPPGRFRAALALGLLAAVAMAPTARAEVFTIGPDLNGLSANDGVFCEGTCLAFQGDFTGAPQFQVRSPVNGTIIRWRIRNFDQAANNTVGPVTPRVVRRAGDDYGPVATGVSRTIGAGDGLVYEFPESLPIQTGDYFGIDIANGGGGPVRSSFAPRRASPSPSAATDGAIVNLLYGTRVDNDPPTPLDETRQESVLLVSADIEVPDPPPPPPPPPETPPEPTPPAPPPLILNFLRVDPVHFVPVFGNGPARSPSLPGHVPPGDGAVIRYRLSRAAEVTFELTSLSRGFMVDGQCRRRTSALTRRLRREIAATLPDGLSPRAVRRALRRGLSALRCAIVRDVPGGTLTDQGEAGNNAFAFDGRLGGRTLPAGVYTLRGQARAADGVLSDVTLRRFRILPAGVRLPRDLLTLARRGFVNQPVFCRTGNTGGCRGTLEFRTPIRRVRGARPATRARSAGRLLGRASFTIRQKRIRFVRVSLPASVQRIVRRRGRVSVVVRVLSRDDTGPAPVLTRRMPLRDIRTRP